MKKYYIRPTAIEYYIKLENHLLSPSTPHDDEDDDERGPQSSRKNEEQVWGQKLWEY
jgi:hypothetical protein